MRPARVTPRRAVSLSVAATVAFGAVALPVAGPTTASALTPPPAFAPCDVDGELERTLGERFGGVWVDAPTQHFRVGLLDPSDEATARSLVERCDVQDAAHGVPAHVLRAPTTRYVVVRSSYPAVRRAQRAVSAWQSSPAGLPLSPRIVSHGIGLGSGDANVDGHVGMVVRVTLHLSTTDAEAQAIGTALAEIAGAHGVTIEIAAERTDYPVALAGEPGPRPSIPASPSPNPATRKPTTTARPTILGRSTVSRRTTLSTRRLPVRLRVSAAGAFRVTVRTADRRRTVVARGTTKAKRAGRITVPTKLTSAGVSRLRTARRTAVTITVEQAGRKAGTRRVVVR